MFSLPSRERLTVPMFSVEGWQVDHGRVYYMHRRLRVITALTGPDGGAVLCVASTADASAAPITRRPVGNHGTVD